MAVFSGTGLDDLCLSLEELAVLSAEVETEMLQEGQRQTLEGLGLVESRALKNSISVKVVQRDGRRRVLVYPAGERPDGQTNNDVGFVLEFGAPDRGIMPRQWMRTANEAHGDQAVEAAAPALFLIFCGGDGVDQVHQLFFRVLLLLTGFDEQAQIIEGSFLDGLVVLLCRHGIYLLVGLFRSFLVLCHSDLVQQLHDLFSGVLVLFSIGEDQAEIVQQRLLGILTLSFCSHSFHLPSVCPVMAAETWPKRSISSSLV